MQSHRNGTMYERYGNSIRHYLSCQKLTCSQVVQSTSEKSSKPHSKRRRSRSYLRSFKDLCLKHTWVLPLVIMAVLLLAYAVNPTTSNPMHSAIFLSYPEPPKTPGGPIMYGKGPKDIAFCCFYTVVLSFTREFLMQRMIRPLAAFCGIRGKGKTARFMEQVYTAIYFAIFGPFGLYVMSRTNIWYFNTTAMFEGFPHRSHEGLFKAYYLLQASYWAQQAIVLLLQLEKPRKDFKELVGHHIITLALIALSYRFHFTYIGLAVYITHDVSDFFLAVRPSTWHSLIRAQYSGGLALIMHLDLQNTQLHRRLHHCSVLRVFRFRLDLSSPCTKPQIPLGCSYRVPNRWTLRVELGNPAVQVLDQSVHYVCPACQLASCERFLAVPDLAYPQELPLHFSQEG